MSASAYKSRRLPFEASSNNSSQENAQVFVHTDTSPEKTRLMCEGGLITM